MMVSLVLFFMILVFSCAGNDIANGENYHDNYEENRIYGKVAGLPGRTILLYELYGDQVNLIDSAMAEPDGSFEFVISPGREHGLYRIAMGKSSSEGQYDRHRQRFDLIWNGSTVVFRTHYVQPVDSMEIILSEENRLYYQFLRVMDDYDRKVSTLSSALVNYPADDSFYRRLERQYRRVQNRRVNYIDNLVKRNHGTILGSIVRFHKIPVIGSPADQDSSDRLKKEFFCQGQFADPVLLRTDLIPRKIMRYLALYAGDNDDEQEEMIDAIDVIMQHAIENEAVYYYVLEYLINGFDSLDMELVSEHLTGRYLLGNICFEEGVLLDHLSLASVEDLKEGDPVPGFSFEALDGRMVDLYDIRAEYTVVFFWGSWCPYCEDVMDDLYELYLDYTNSQEGFLEVVAIGIEDDRQMWIDHLNRGGYDWINYSSLQRWECPVVTDYRLVGTPTMILLDSDKRFIDEPTRIRALNRLLSRRLR